MAYTYPVAHEGTDISFLLCRWNPSGNNPYRTIYCPICDKNFTHESWKPLIKHENRHLKKLGCNSFGKGSEDKEAVVKELFAKADAHVQDNWDTVQETERAVPPKTNVIYKVFT
jgi:hypothetical protein